ncbi:MAG: cation diffusion facilitator family transporter [Hyphomicrobium sp.]|uniref:cation diffusion facilitator family transporter n=1 Tax=Hyphomicrobium sp. TaxID=82 RepID=UPI003D0C20F0
MHTHSHEHGPHDHAHGSSQSERRIGLAALLTGAFMVAEAAGGVVSGSLALIADAGHMLTDFAGLALAWLGFRMARRPADWKRSYGYDRFGVLVAFANGLALFAIAGWIVAEAVQRLGSPGDVLGGVMFWVALAGLGVNLAAFRLLSHGDHGNLNVRAAVLHVIGDLLGSVAALAASLVILTTGWTPIDPILSILVAVLILGSAARVVRDAGHILLEGTPAGLDPRQIGADIVASVSGVADVHHVHAWSLSQDRIVVTLHARLADAGVAPEAITAAIKEHLKATYGVDHATVEIEIGRCADANVSSPDAPQTPVPR